jgi:hypothetical protein
MATIIVSIDVEDENVKGIKQQLQWLKEGMTPDGTGWFNPDGRIAIDDAMLERDTYDDNFYLFDFIEVVENKHHNPLKRPEGYTVSDRTEG